MNIIKMIIDCKTMSNSLKESIVQERVADLKPRVEAMPRTIDLEISGMIVKYDNLTRKFTEDLLRLNELLLEQIRSSET